jgi:UDP-N-acetylmuramoylalanine--D-glutamate ligase
VNLLVVGAAVSGVAAAGLGRRLEHHVIVYDRNPAALVALEENSFPTHSGPWDPDLLASADLVVTSPGIPEHAQPIRDTMAAGIPLWSEMEFAAQQLTAPYAAITGTNGKTTVVAATTAMLETAGIKAAAAGNIGRALSDVVGEPLDVIVIEASSFQLRFIERFHPVAAAILNVAPDHLDWHGSLAAYSKAKQRIYENMAPGDILVYDADDPGAIAAVTTATARRIPVSGNRLPLHGNGPDGDSLFVGEMTLSRPPFDTAYTMDLTAAATLAAALGAERQAIESVVTGFSPGEHRRTIVGTWAGVQWVDDSKATNPHSAVASAAAYPSVVLIAGGRNKSLDLAPIAEVASIRHVIGIGEAAVELAGVIEPDRYTHAADLETAVTLADLMATNGDTVLLAPGCASFDMFDSYARRGEEFTRIVRARKGETGGQ